MATVAQNRRRPLVVPIVDDPLQDVDVASLGRSLEEIAGHEFGAGQRAAHAGPGRVYADRPVEQNPRQMRISGQDGGEQLTVPSPDIHHALERREVVSFRQGFIGALAQRDHGALEQRRLVRMRFEPIEPRRAENMFERRPSRSDGMQKVGERPIGLAVDHAHKITRASRPVGPQGFTELRLGEPPRRRLAKHALAREQPHDSIERVRVRSRLAGEVIGRPLSPSRTDRRSPVRRRREGPATI